MKPFLATLQGTVQKTPPFWFMRQAGRYLPEYRELRAKAGGFLNMVFNPDMAVEVTLQPLRRFNMDAAILFSDILVIPHALNQNVSFTAGEGPKLNPLRCEADLSLLSKDRFDEILEPVYETVRGIRKNMIREKFSDTALIGFAGAPWTVACYMVEGGGSRDFINIKNWIYTDPEGFSKLIDIVVEATICYLKKQIEAGAEAIQIFDSWSGVLDEKQFRRWVIDPTHRITQNLKKTYPDIPIIGFPRGAGPLYRDYVQKTGITAISIDSQIPTEWAVENLQTQQSVQMSIQGNLDPACLLAGGDMLRETAENIMATFSGKPFIFNLGHGIIKETPPEHVEQLVSVIRRGVS